MQSTLLAYTIRKSVCRVCACSGGLILDHDGRNCKGKVHYKKEGGGGGDLLDSEQDLQ